MRREPSPSDRPGEAGSAGLNAAAGREAILDHPANAGVVRSLCRKRGRAATIAASDAMDDPYLECGSHPEIVERVWDQLGHGMPANARLILCGTPVLVHPAAGLILAVCHGTSYCLRVPLSAVAAALQAGCKVAHRWGDGKMTDLSDEFGPDWVFGCWARDETAWLQAVITASGEAAEASE